MNNASGKTFSDISSELWREYSYLHTDAVISIDAPKYLHVSATGGHRIHAADGTNYYIAPGWACITWLARAGQPDFAL